MIRRPPRSTRLTHSFPTLRSSDLEWIKKAVILYFPIRKMKVIEVGPFVFHDKMKLKTNYKELGVRVVPHGLARYRSEEHTSELQSLMRISYAVFCLKKKNKT